MEEIFFPYKRVETFLFFSVGKNLCFVAPNANFSSNKKNHMRVREREREE
jgi:hypothetical protein